MRALFVIKSLSLPGGGAEKVLSEVASTLAGAGHDIRVASFDGAGTADFYPFHSHVKRIRLGIGESTVRSGPADVLRKIGALHRLIKGSTPDVAIGFMHSAFVPLALAAARCGIPVIGSEHTAVDHYRDRPLQLLLVRASAAKLAALTIPSERIRRGFPAWLAQRMTVIPNPVSQPQEKSRRSSSRPLLLAVGALRKEKNHSLLISAFASIASMFPPWILRIVGDGPCRSTLESQVKDLGLAQRISFAGAVADVAAEYAAADLLAVPSAYESFGLATAEALAHGVPAVGFADCPGTNELIVDRINGILVVGQDRAQALATGLAELMRDGRLRRRLAAAAPATVTRYASGAVVRKWEMLFDEVLERSPL